MSRKLRPLAALATVALIGGGGAISFAADGNTASKGSSSAPGTLPSMASSGSEAASSAPGRLPSMASSGPEAASSAPGRLPSMAS